MNAGCDARLNLVGEGAPNDVLRAFIAMVGIKPVADRFLEVKGAGAAPWRGWVRWSASAAATNCGPAARPDVPVRCTGCAGRRGRSAARSATSAWRSAGC
ncbi:MAG: hypothetical protein U0736_01325 [Gemmataceae bacterium]